MESFTISTVNYSIEQHLPFAYSSVEVTKNGKHYLAASPAISLFRQCPGKCLSQVLYKEDFNDIILHISKIKMNGEEITNADPIKADSFVDNFDQDTFNQEKFSVSGKIAQFQANSRQQLSPGKMLYDQTSHKRSYLEVYEHNPMSKSTQYRFTKADISSPIYGSEEEHMTKHTYDGQAKKSHGETLYKPSSKELLQELVKKREKNYYDKNKTEIELYQSTTRQPMHNQNQQPRKSILTRFRETLHSCCPC